MEADDVLRSLQFVGFSLNMFFVVFVICCQYFGYLFFSVLRNPLLNTQFQNCKGFISENFNRDGKIPDESDLLRMYVC